MATTSTSASTLELAGDRATRDARYWADVIDVWLAPAVVLTTTSNTLGTIGEFLGPFVVAGAYVAMEATTGRTPGKWGRDLVTVGVDGQPIGWRAAAVRRSWMLVLPLGAVVSALSVLSLLALGSLAWTIGRDPHAQGWHDRLAGTAVVPVDAERVAPRRRKLLISGIVLAVIAIAVLADIL